MKQIPNSKNPAYRNWKLMRQRCLNRNNKDFRYYGGRGIKICKRWDKFENFLADMGPRPVEGYTVERRNNNKGYSPKNCYWATRIDQGRNSRNVKLTKDEVRQINIMLSHRVPQTTLARVFGVSRQTISAIQCKEAWA